MLMELTQEGKGPIEIMQAIPEHLQNFLKQHTLALAVKGTHCDMLFQQFPGEGFAVWYSHYRISAPVIIRAKADLPVLELRIALKNQINGEWDKIANPALAPHYFQMGFVPHVVTRAVFEKVADYQTFDIHFDIAFLQQIGIDYKTLDRFLNNVVKDQPAELSKFSHPCSPLMLDSISNILNNNFSAAGKKHLLRNCVTNILIAALEQVGKEEIGKLPLSAADIEALHHVRQLIEQNAPVYLSNDVLVAKAHPRLNAFKLSYGFKRIFGINPYDYYLQLRFALGKQLLREGHSVSDVAAELEYDSSTTFIKEFRKRFGYTPKQFQKYGD